jgi:hypothetical protein
MISVQLLAVILGAISAVAVIFVVVIKWSKIVKWFRSRSEIKEADKANIAFTIKQKCNNGDYKVVQGIFNKRTENIVDGLVYQSKKIDSKLDEVHANKELVIYE